MIPIRQRVKSDSRSLLIVTADDLGMTEETNQGIAAAFRDGCVTCASLMVNTDSFDSACLVVRQNPQLTIGLHVNLTFGKPVSKPGAVGTLIRRDGTFFPKWQFVQRCLGGKVDSDELLTEIIAQLDRANRNAIAIKFLNSHHHVHVLPQVHQVMEKVAARNGLLAIRKITWPNPAICPPSSIGFFQQLCLAGLQSLRESAFFYCDYFVALNWSIFISRPFALQQILQRLPRCIIELMCHPGYLPQNVAGQRHIELRALCEPEIPRILRDLNVELATF